ncbi:MAG: preprotein translocase subunit SecG [Campylobacterota bacterium]|nr:preprotein translocase subunit SecG [Campylobacterota bacterium]
MTSTLLTVQFILAIIITITVLLQKSASMGLGAYSGSNDSVFGAKGPGNILTKVTFFLAALFIANTLSLGYFYNQERLQSAVDTVETNSLIPQSPVTLPQATPAAPAAPVAPAK